MRQTATTRWYRSMSFSVHRTVRSPILSASAELTADRIGGFVVDGAELAAFGSIDPEQTDPLTADVNRVAVDDRRFADDVCRCVVGRDDKQHGKGENQAMHRGKFDGQGNGNRFGRLPHGTGTAPAIWRRRPDPSSDAARRAAGGRRSGWGAVWKRVLAAIDALLLKEPQGATSLQ